MAAPESKNSLDRLLRAGVAALDALRHLEEDPPSPRFWTTRVRWLAGSIAALVLLLSTLGLHQYSLPLWHGFIDGSPATEVIAGTPRQIRFDDVVVDLPSVISQTQVSPRLPAVNPTIGLGQNMEVPNGLPVLGLTMLFRPGTWGFLIGTDFGLAWRWWIRELGLLFAAFAFFFHVAGRRFWTGLFAAAALVWSPFMQHWSLNAGELYLFAFLTMLGIIWLAGSTTPKGSYAAGAFTGWAGTGFGLNLYPPYQVTIGYLIIAVAALYGGQALWRADRASRRRLLIGAGIALLVCAIGVVNFYLNTRHTIWLMRHTVYPGDRVAEGGSHPLLEMFDMMLLSPWTKDWANLANICEASEFYYVFPLALAFALATRDVRDRVLRTPLFYIAAALTALLIGWQLEGYPSWFAKATLLTLVPVPRTDAGLGIPTMMLVVLGLATTRESDTPPPRWLTTIAVGAWMALLLRAGLVVWDEMRPLGVNSFIAYFLAWTLAGALLVRGRRLGLALVAAIAIAATTPFNPLVRGGTDFILGNPLSAKMRELTAASPGSRWLVMGSPILAQLPRMLGVPAINGTLYHPQLELWQRFDSDGRYMPTYNRYADIVAVPSTSASPVFSNPQHDAVLLQINPKHPELKRLGVRFFLVDGDSLPFDSDPASFRLEYQYAGHKIYQRLDESTGN